MTNLVVNPGAETGDMTGWSSTGWYASTISHNSGSYTFYYTGSTNTVTMSQSLTLTIGNTYQVSFYVRGGLSTLTLSIGNNVIATVNNMPANVFDYRSANFIASNTTEKIVFSDTLAVNDVSIYLDDISVYSLAPTNQPTSQPSTAPSPKPTPLPTKPTSVIINTDLSKLQPHQGFVINGANAGDQLGYSVSSAGDVNGDGYDDIVIGAPFANSNKGKIYIIYGRAINLNVNISSLSSMQGIVITYPYACYASKAGDVNGDGYADIIIGVPQNQYTTDTGNIIYTGGNIAYLIFGSKNLTNMDLGNLATNQGISFNGKGWAVSGAGDINKDSYDDIIISAPGTNTNNKIANGIVYVIYGGSALFSITLSNNIDSSKGFVINGANTYDNLGYSVSSAGDINGDGYDDILVGSKSYESANSYIIYGKINLNSFNLDIFNSTQVSVLSPFGIGGDRTGRTVSSAGDVNGDGYDDNIICAYHYYSDNKGVCSLIYGSANFARSPVQSFLITGINGGDYTGWSVSGAGDINGDGYDDIVIGAYGTNSQIGKTYIIFGKSSNTGNINLVSLTASQGFSISGVNTGDKSGFSVGGARDFNGDGYADYIIGAPGANSNAGAVYVLYGNQYQTYSPTSQPTAQPSAQPTAQPSRQPTSQPSTAPSPKPTPLPTKSTSVIINTDLSKLQLYQGFVINGINAGDQLGYSVSNAGDVNGDDKNDIVIGTYGCVHDGSNVNKAYLLYGNNDLSGINLINFTTTQGLTFVGKCINSITTAGDVNGDGKDDVLIGAPYANGNEGKVYIIYGNNNLSSNTTISLENLNINQGVILKGYPTNAGSSVNSAGDINGDGKDDVLISGNNSPYYWMYRIYVVYGSDSLPLNIDLSLGSQITISECCYYFSNVGDINGDGKADILIGHPPYVYLIYGSASLSNINFANLAPSQGITITGSNVNDNTGISISSAGDFDGDGKADILIGAPGYSSNTGKVYIIYGNNSLSNIDLSLPLPLTKALTITGVNIGDQLGSSVSSAGDVNGDGYSDIIIGAHGANFNAGKVYIIFGKAYNSDHINLANLTSARGFSVLGMTSNDKVGWSVSKAGDINNDGYADYLIGAPGVNYNAGAVYVLYGNQYQTYSPTSQPSAQPSGQPTAQPTLQPSTKPSVEPTGQPSGQPSSQPTNTPTAQPSIQPTAQPSAAPSPKPTPLPTKSPSAVMNTDLSLLQPYQGFAINGASTGDQFGYSVSNAGDFNGDGLDDVIIGGAHTCGSYIIFGKSSGIIDINLDNLNSSQWVSIYWPACDSTYIVSGAGDVNNDGFYDIVMGMPNANSSRGVSYVVFGNKIPTNINLINLITTQGFAIYGENEGDKAGFSVSDAGDFNHDGFADIIIGVPYAYTSCNSNLINWYGRETYCKGISYVIYGNNTLTNIYLSALNTAQGFSIIGANYYDLSGSSVSAAGDINNDGYLDIVVGAWRGGSGKTYVIYGNSINQGTISLASLSASQGFIIHGIYDYQFVGYSVSGARDVNGDGYDDIIIGAPMLDQARMATSYVIFGNKTLSNIYLSSLTLAQGITIANAMMWDQAGWSVSDAGDINGDGYSDIIIGAPGNVYGNRDVKTCTSYLVFGKADYININLASITNDQGFSISGIASKDLAGSSVSSIGDFNGDGYSDYIIGAPGVNNNAGAAYVLFGNQYQTHFPTSQPSAQPSSQPTSEPTSAPTDVSSLQCMNLNGKRGSLSILKNDDRLNFTCSINENETYQSINVNENIFHQTELDSLPNGVISKLNTTNTDNFCISSEGDQGSLQVSNITNHGCNIKCSYGDGTYANTYFNASLIGEDLTAKLCDQANFV